MRIQVKTQSTLCAIDSVALLPKHMTSVAPMGVLIGLVLYEGLKDLLIAAFVDIGSTLEAAKISSGLFKLMLLPCWGLVPLLLQDLLDDLLSGLFFRHWLMVLCWFRWPAFRARLGTVSL